MTDLGAILAIDICLLGLLLAIVVARSPRPSRDHGRAIQLVIADETPDSEDDWMDVAHAVGVGGTPAAGAGCWELVALGTWVLCRDCVEARRDNRSAEVCADCEPRLGMGTELAR